MRILLIAATSFEVGPAQEFIQTNNLDSVEVLITGVGLMAAVYNLSKAVHQSRPDLVIQAGVAGSFDPQLTKGQVVFVESDSSGDLGVFENGRFRSLFDMNLLDPNQFPWQNGRLPAISPSVPDVKLSWVHATTVNEITTQADRITYYRENLGTQIESMEGAALHYVCLQENLLFLQLRSISNEVGIRDKSQWNMKEAIANLNDVLCSLLQQFSKS